MTERAWNYFNGGTHGRNGPQGYVPAKPTTVTYCAERAPDSLPGYDKTVEPGREHWNTDFRCTPWRIGLPCAACGKDI
jgi:hypothetical protein